MIHALRVGAVRATSLDQLINDTIKRRDKTVQWLEPDHPVIPAIAIGRRSFLDLTRPARTEQTLSSMHAMALKAGIRPKLTVHDMRRGSIRDIAHLQRNLHGFADTTTAAAVGHSMKSFMADITEDYTGGSAAPVWNYRAESNFTDPRAPDVANTPFTPTRSTPAEIEAFCNSQGWDPKKKADRHRAGKGLREEQENKWRAMTKDELDNAVLSKVTAPAAKDLPVPGKQKHSAQLTLLFGKVILYHYQFPLPFSCKNYTQSTAGKSFYLDKYLPP